MISNQITKQHRVEVGIKDKVRGYAQLLKFRLSLIVALSAVFGYAMATKDASVVIWSNLWWIGLGGLMITGASNAFNQLLEKDTDTLMKRTSTRPLPQEVLNNTEVLWFALIVSILGVGIIGYVFNLPAALLGIIGLLSYAFVYTPMKRVSPFAVFVGAIPGALPPLIGWVAYTGQIDSIGLLLFAFQFFWQFPHFWAIAWILDEDYQRAGFRLLPSSSGKSRFSTMLILVYTFCLIPLALFPFKSEIVGVTGMILLMVSAAMFAIPALKLHRTLEDKWAKKLMFASFLYLPAIQLIFLLG